MRSPNWTWMPGVVLAVVLAGAASAQTVVINEFMSSNLATLADVDGAFSDWIEIHNPGTTAIDLTGGWLSDDPLLPLKWQFPQGTVPAGGFLLVWASDKNGVLAGGQLHTNFKISASGETLLLTAADGSTLLDQAPAMALLADQSYGRQPDGTATWAVYPVATPGATNGVPTTVVPTPVFSARRRLPGRTVRPGSWRRTIRSRPSPTRWTAASPRHHRRCSRVRSRSTTVPATRRCTRRSRRISWRPATRPGGRRWARSTRSRWCGRAPSVPGRRRAPSPHGRSSWAPTWPRAALSR